MIFLSINAKIYTYIFINNLILMPIDTQDLLVTESVLEFKSRAINVSTLILFSPQLDDIQEKLQQKIAQAPDFFRNSPLLINLAYLLTHSQSIDITKLILLLRELEFLPIGVQGGSKSQHQIAIAAGVPVHTMPVKKITQPDSVQKPVIKKIEVKLITQPVRSGQRIYAQGDLIILAQVSAGAEVMAEGNIHIYASLRGRALAGVQGDISRRIFCADLQAELVSIAGNYRLNDSLDNSLSKQNVQVFLQDQALIIEAL